MLTGYFPSYYGEKGGTLLVPVLRDRTEKPPLGTPLRSDGHWSVQWLVGAWAFNEGVGNTAFGGIGNNAALVLPTWNANGLLFNRVATAYATAVVPASDAYSIFSIQRHDGTVNTRSIIDQDYPTPNRIFQYRVESTNKPAFIAFNTVATPFTVTADNAIAAHTPFAMCATAVNTSLTLWVNGVQKTGSLSGTLAGLSTTLPVYFGRRADGSNPQPYGGTLHFVAIFSRALSPSEIASLSANPWQIYEPEVYWIEVGARQYGFRFRNDDGNESSATWIQPQNTSIELPKDKSARLRIQLASTGTDVERFYQLEYRKLVTGDSPFIPVLRDRTEKPPLGTPLRRDGHWSVQGLVGAWAFNEGAGSTAFDAARGLGAVLGSGGSWSPVGIVINNTGAGVSASNSYLSQSFTFISEVDRASAVDEDSIVESGANGIEWKLTSGGKSALLKEQNTNLGLSTSSRFIAGNYVAAVSYSASGVLTHYWNGQKDGTATNVQTFTFSNYAFKIGGSFEPFNGKIYWLLAYNIDKTPAQIKFLSENPWQVYEPEVCWISRAEALSWKKLS